MKDKFASKKISILKKIAVPILVAIILIPANIGLGYLITPPRFALYFNHDMEVIAEEGMDIDLLFAGNSRVYRAFAPQIFEDEMDLTCAVNAATADATTVGIYYTIKDIAENYTVKRVVIGVSFDTFYDNKVDSYGNMIVYDRLSSKNRTAFLRDSLSGDGWLHIFPIFRYRGELPNVVKNLALKKAIIESNYTLREEIVEGEGYYLDKGFIYCDTSISTGNMPISGSGTFSEDKIINSKVEYLVKSIEFCRENDIEVCLCIVPTTVMRTYNIKNYQGAVDYYEALAEEHGVNLYNLSYLIGREEFLPDEMMYDFSHLNGEGGYILSGIFADILNKADAGEDVSSYFYNNLDEFKADVHRIVAVKATIDFKKENTGPAEISFKSLQNEDVTPLYKVEIKENDGSYRTLVDWTSEKKVDVDIPYEGNYTIKVTAWSGVDGEAVAWQEYEF